VRSIIHCTSVHPWDDVRIFQKECVSLKAAGYNVNLLTSTGIPHIHASGVKIIQVKLPLNRFLRMMLGNIKFTYHVLLNNYDVIHIHDPELIPMGLISRIFKNKVILDLHEYLPDQVLSKYWIPKYLRSVISICTKVLLSISTRFFSGVITADELILDMVSNSKKIAVRNFPILKEFSEINIESKKRAESYEIRMCYLGAISKARGLESMINLLHELRKDSECSLVLYGRIHDPEFAKKIENNDLPLGLSYGGIVGRNDVASTLNRFDIGLALYSNYPAYQNAIHAIKTYEYLLSGVVPVVPSFAKWKEYWNEKECILFVDSESIQDMKTTIIDACKRDGHLISMVNNGRNWIYLNSYWESESNVLFNFYNDLLADKVVV
jgi:glycosyltransferase involved in cell wall biosynthesis